MEKATDVAWEDDKQEQAQPKQEVLETIETPMRKLSFPLVGGKPFLINPITTIFGIAVLWSLSIWCMTDPDNARAQLGTWQTAAVTQRFTWFYVGTNPLLTVSEV